MYTHTERIAIQRKLVRIAATLDWSTRTSLFEEEQALLSQQWVSIFRKRDIEKDLRAKKFLMLTSLPFFVYETDEDDLIEHYYTQCQICLESMWRIRAIDSTAVLPTGNIAPEYFFIAGEFLEAIPDYVNLSYAHDVFMRKALVASGLNEVSWISHLLKFPGLRLEKELVKRYTFIEREIELTQPKMIIALGKKVRQAISHSNIPSDIPLVTVTEPEYYIKHKMPYSEYAEALKNVIAEEWRKMSNE